MEIRRINPEFAVSDQLTLKDVTQAHAMGYAAVLCLRPDGEDPAQPLYESIAAAAEATQITASYLPISPSGPTDQDVIAFTKVYADLPKPVLAYCKTGGRALSTYLRAYPKET